MSYSDSEVNNKAAPGRDRVFSYYMGSKHVKRLQLKPQIAASSTMQYAHFISRRIKQLRHSRLLNAAASNNSMSILEQIRLGVSPNTADDQGRSALHIAASKGYTDVVKTLLDNGADPNLNDKLRNTPLHLAACTHNLSVISLLLQAGAELCKIDLYGKNPLQLAVSKLQLLQKSWREGSIEIMHLREEMQLIVDVMKSVMAQNKKKHSESEGVEGLQLMKLSITNSHSEIDVDDQMSRLLDQLQTFTI